jgi:hypothetical protein
MRGTLSAGCDRVVDRRPRSWTEADAQPSAPTATVAPVSADTFTEHRVVLDDGPARSRCWRECFGEPAGELYIWRNPNRDRDPAFLHAPVFELPVPRDGWLYELIRIEEREGHRVAYYRLQPEL